MNEKKIPLRDLRRAIEDFGTHRRDLESCDIGAWDPYVVSFKNYLKETSAVGEEILSLVGQAKGDLLPKLFVLDGGGMPESLASFDSETDRLAYIGRLIIEVPSHKIRAYGFQLAHKHDRAFDYMRNNVISVFFDRITTRLHRKLEDLTNKHQDDADLIPFSQTFIFATTAIVHTGTGDINVDMRSMSRLGTDVLLRRIDELEKVLQAAADEQSRAAVASEADDLALHKKLDEIKAAVGGGQVERATGLWTQFVKEATVHNLTDAAGKVIDTVTLLVWMLNLSQGKPPNSGL